MAVPQTALLKQHICSQTTPEALFALLNVFHASSPEELTKQLKVLLLSQIEGSSDISTNINKSSNHAINAEKKIEPKNNNKYANTNTNIARLYSHVLPQLNINQILYDDILLHIFEYIAIKQRFQMHEISNHFRKLVSDSVSKDHSLWFRICDDECGIATSIHDDDINFPIDIEKFPNAVSNIIPKKISNLDFVGTCKHSAFLQPMPVKLLTAIIALGFAGCEAEFMQNLVNKMKVAKFQNLKYLSITSEKWSHSLSPNLVAFHAWHMSDDISLAKLHFLRLFEHGNLV